MKKVAIIGAGVMGIGCAVRIKEKYPDFEVTIFTKDTTPNTTGDGAAGLWGPFFLGTTPKDKILQWSRETRDFFHDLWREGNGGASVIPCIRINRKTITLPAWKDLYYGYKNLSETEVEYWRKNYPTKTIKSVQSFVTYTCEGNLLLKYLMENFEKLGGKLVQQGLFSLDDVLYDDFDIVINCIGLSAKYVVPDPKVFPVRGQTAKVKAPWIYHVLLGDSDDGNYIIPNINSVVLGGTYQKNNFNTNICVEDSKFVREGCEQILPGLKNVPTLFEWVGLRPGRESVRLEKSNVKLNVNGKEKILIHNYGHGGSGVTMFWGCAREVVDIVTDALKEQTKSKL